MAIVAFMGLRDLWSLMFQGNEAYDRFELLEILVFQFPMVLEGQLCTTISSFNFFFG